MDTIYKNYIDLYGNFSHILNIKIDKSLSEDEKRIILFDIYDLINEKEIKKNISKKIISIKWRVLEANVGRYNVAQHSLSLPTELLGGHVVPTENVSEGVYDESDLLHYFTDSNDILSDKEVYEHTKLLINNIKTIAGAKNSDRFIINLSKLLRLSPLSGHNVPTKEFSRSPSDAPKTTY